MSKDKNYDSLSDKVKEELFKAHFHGDSVTDEDIVYKEGDITRIIFDLEKELKVTESLLADRQRLLDAIPECKTHGKCVPHALDWIKEAKKAINKSNITEVKEEIVSHLVDFAKNSDVDSDCKGLKDWFIQILEPYKIVKK